MNIRIPYTHSKIAVSGNSWQQQVNNIHGTYLFVLVIILFIMCKCEFFLGQTMEDSGGWPQNEPDRMGGGSTRTQEAGWIHRVAPHR
jgi:hypothetical protein